MIIVIIIFLLFCLILFYGNFKNKSKSLLIDKDNKISVIVAAKNEEQNIPSLITFLSKQDYPKENYEVIIIDDNSHDHTFEVTKKNIEILSNFSVLKVSRKKYIGKRGALQFGIECSIHPNILITDADCKPQKNWIKEFASKFNEGYDFIFGIAPYQQNNSLINKIVCFENLRTHILTFGFAGIGLPYSAAARSFGFKKESFLNIEGYQNTTDTLSGDDDLLIREAVKHKLKIGTLKNKDAAVFSTAKNTLMEFINQKARHTSTSNYYSYSIKFLLGLWHLTNLVMMFSPILMIFNVNFIFLIICKIIFDLLLIRIFMKSFLYDFGFVQIIYLQFIYEILIIVNYIKGLFSTNRW